MPKFVVLQIEDLPDSSEQRLIPLKTQVVEFENAEMAAIAMAPQPDDLDDPTRVVVIPFRNWHEFEIYLESVKGNDQYTVYSSTHSLIEV